MFFKNRHIGESGRLISDIMEIFKTKEKRFLDTMGIEKAFESLGHNFLFSDLEKYGLGKNFISCLKGKGVAKKQESYVLNGGTTTKYFLFRRDAC